MNHVNLLGKSLFTKKTVSIALVALFVMGSTVTVAKGKGKEKNAVSPAEQAALASDTRDKTKELISLCHHGLLYASETKKAKLIDKLDGKTCKEMVNLHFSN